MLEGTERSKKVDFTRENGAFRPPGDIAAGKWDSGAGGKARLSHTERAVSSYPNTVFPLLAIGRAGPLSGRVKLDWPSLGGGTSWPHRNGLAVASTGQRRGHHISFS